MVVMRVETCTGRRNLRAHAAFECEQGFFEAVVAGVNDRGTWVRALRPAVEGRLVEGERDEVLDLRVDVGDPQGPRRIIAPLARGYRADELIGRRVIGSVERVAGRDAASAAMFAQHRGRRRLATRRSGTLAACHAIA